MPTYKVIILKSSSSSPTGYTITGECLGHNLSESEAYERAREYNEAQSGTEGIGPHGSRPGGIYAVSVPDTDGE